MRGAGVPLYGRGDNALFSVVRNAPGRERLSFRATAASSTYMARTSLIGRAFAPEDEGHSGHGSDGGKRSVSDAPEVFSEPVNELVLTPKQPTRPTARGWAAILGLVLAAAVLAYPLTFAVAPNSPSTSPPDVAERVLDPAAVRPSEVPSMEAQSSEIANAPDPALDPEGAASVARPLQPPVRPDRQTAAHSVRPAGESGDHAEGRAATEPLTVRDQPVSQAARAPEPQPEANLAQPSAPETSPPLAPIVAVPPTSSEPAAPPLSASPAPVQSAASAELAPATAFEPPPQADPSVAVLHRPPDAVAEPSGHSPLPERRSAEPSAPLKTPSLPPPPKAESPLASPSAVAPSATEQTKQTTPSVADSTGSTRANQRAEPALSRTAEPPTSKVGPPSSKKASSRTQARLKVTQAAEDDEDAAEDDEDEKPARPAQRRPPAQMRPAPKPKPATSARAERPPAAAPRQAASKPKAERQPLPRPKPRSTETAGWTSARPHPKQPPRPAPQQPRPFVLPDALRPSGL